MVRTGATFAEAAAEWLVYVEQQRACKPRAVADYSMMVRILNQSFGDRRLEEFTPEGFETWKIYFARERRLSNRTLQKYLVVLHAIFKRAMKVHGLPGNPLAVVERPRLPRRAEIDVFSREEVMALVGAAASRPGRRALSHGRLHRPAARRAARPALGGCRLALADDPRSRSTGATGWRDDAEERAGEGGALMPEVGDALDGLRRARPVHRRRRLVFCTRSAVTWARSH